MKFLKVALLVITAITVVGCATNYRIDTDYDSEYSFQHKKRFAVKTPQIESQIPQDLLNQRIEKSITSAFVSRGFHSTSKDEADFLVSYFFTTEEKQEIINYNSFYGYHGYHHCHHCYGFGVNTVHVRDYKEGTLIIDIIDPKTRTIKWRGATSTRLHHLTIEEKDQLFNEVVTAILVQFPPHQNPATE